MMRMLSYSLRTAKEILRDPLNLGFGLGFPLVLLFLLSAIQANIPVSLFAPEMLTPGLTVFGLAFMTLFSAALIAKDRSSSLLQRLYTTPLRPADYILGYMLPVLPISAAQCVLCYLAAACLGLKLTVNVLWAVLLLIPAEIFFIALGLLCGSVLTDKQVGGICGALLTNLTAWLSGTWFSLDLVGGWFKRIAFALPFANGVELGRAAVAGDYTHLTPYLWWCLGYTVVLTVLAIAVFRRRMKQ